ncbi:enoyl-CoA hydratase/isomerase family protein [Novosphingobium lentum]|uniref:enoyl-CoA hydratase/isomerase family protein n=1 Tax=Novosphingobium lentum TaxID=145287 RepID=UPI0008319081|nr:enoyl-CoA hydratase-related protein [Novosphingobium lentum]
MIAIGAFTLNVAASGVATVVFSRPPVNAVSLSVYEDIGRLVSTIHADAAIRVVVLTAPDHARAWCGGADLNDFVGMNPERRKDRYRFINEQMPGFYHLDRPVIAAMNGHAVGIGMIWAGLCDMRVAAEDAALACPEIDFGLVCGGAGLFAMLNLPEAKVREILYTGRKFTARELEPTGFFNYVMPKAEVLPKALELAGLIAAKSLPAVRARKIASNALEGRSWMQAYLDAQALSAELAAGRDGGEGVRAFLENRRPDLADH